MLEKMCLKALEGSQLLLNLRKIMIFMISYVNTLLHPNLANIRKDHDLNPAPEYSQEYMHALHICI